MRIAVRLPGADVELPAVPGAAQDFALAGVADVAGEIGFGKPDQRAFAERRALVRTAIEQAKEFALHIEDGDWTVFENEEFARPRRQFAHRGNDVTSYAGDL